MTERHPVVTETNNKRDADFQLRVADSITAFAGSMRFVYIHAVIFGVWCATGLFGTDKFPFNFLTMAVSLEAIFLATFVMVGQNRQADFAQRKADHDYKNQVQELRTNTKITREVHTLSKEIRSVLNGKAPTKPVRRTKKNNDS